MTAKPATAKKPDRFERQTEWLNRMKEITFLEQLIETSNEVQIMAFCYGAFAVHPDLTLNPETKEYEPSPSRFTVTHIKTGKPVKVGFISSPHAKVFAFRLDATGPWANYSHDLFENAAFKQFAGQLYADIGAPLSNTCLDLSA